MALDDFVEAFYGRYQVPQSSSTLGSHHGFERIMSILDRMKWSAR